MAFDLKHAALAAVAATIGSGVCAQDAPSLRDLERSKKSFIAANEEFGEAIWPMMVAPYNRTEPGLGDLFPGKEWNDEDRDVYGCAYDKLIEADAMEDFQRFQVANAKMAAEFGSNDNITIIELFGIETDEPLIMKFYAEEEDAFERVAGVVNDCGGGELASRRMAENGTMDLVFAAMRKAMGEE